MAGGGGGGNQTLVESNQPWEGVQPYLIQRRFNGLSTGGLYPRAADLLDDEFRGWRDPQRGRLGVADLRESQYDAWRGRQGYLSGPDYQNLANAMNFNVHGLMLAGDPSNPAMRASTVLNEAGLPEHIASYFRQPDVGNLINAYNNYSLLTPRHTLRFPSAIKR